MKRVIPAYPVFIYVVLSGLMMSTITGCISAPPPTCISYSWSDEKGNWVQALKQTIGGKRPRPHELPLHVIRNQFFGIGGAGFSWRGDKEYVRNNLSDSEQEEFFRAIQRALRDTGVVKYRLNYPGSIGQCIGLPRDDDVILELRGC